MVGGGRRKECGPGYPDGLVFLEKTWIRVWGGSPCLSRVGDTGCHNPPLMLGAVKFPQSQGRNVNSTLGLP